MTAELPSEESLLKVNELLQHGLAQMMLDPRTVATVVQRAKNMQTAMAVDGEYTDPELGIVIKADTEGGVTIYIPPSLGRRLAGGM